MNTHVCVFIWSHMYEFIYIYIYIYIYTYLDNIYVKYDSDVSLHCFYYFIITYFFAGRCGWGDECLIKSPLIGDI